MSAFVVNQLPLAPLGAGDLIDRAVRLYRRHFFILIRIAAPPVIVAAAGSILVAICWRQLFLTESEVSLALLVVLMVIGVFLMLAGNVFSMIVMGGATRNLVTHLLWNEPVSARATYAAVRSRFWGLLGATVVVMIWVGVSAFIAFIAWYMVVIFLTFGAIMLVQVAPEWVGIFVGAVGFIVSSVLGLWLLFFLAGRVAYVPQAMLVEGKGVFEAVSRSFSLASGNVRRLMAMAVFTSFATYSALMILIIPLGVIAWLAGIGWPFSQADSPAWYSIGYNVISQASYVLLAPIWMLGLSLLYVDERVRHEGYDIELMAARQLTEMPKLDVSSPLAPAISLDRRKAPPPPMPTGSVLGLR
jgi:hypothetical protein